MMRSPPPFSMNLAERPMPAFGDRSASPTQTFRSWPLQPGPGGMDGLTCTSSYNRLAISCISAQLCEDLCAIRRRGHLRDHWLNLPNWVREMELMFFRCLHDQRRVVVRVTTSSYVESKRLHPTCKMASPPPRRVDLPSCLLLHHEHRKPTSRDSELHSIHVSIAPIVEPVSSK